MIHVNEFKGQLVVRDDVMQCVSTITSYYKHKPTTEKAWAATAFNNSQQQDSTSNTTNHPRTGRSLASIPQKSSKEMLDLSRLKFPTPMFRHGTRPLRALHGRSKPTDTIATETTVKGLCQQPPAVTFRNKVGGTHSVVRSMVSATLACKDMYLNYS